MTTAPEISADVIVLGAGAAGMMCAAEAGRRGRSVILIDHAATPGEKIRISGGGRCNFTNVHASPAQFLSRNPKFCVSALRRFTAADFIARVDARGIAWHEKTLGQLFCDGSARQIVDMLVDDCRNAGVAIRPGLDIGDVARDCRGFRLATSTGEMTCARLVVATGGPSIPKMGASGFAYRLAAQFGVPVVTPRPALVPLTFEGATLDRARALAGVSVDAEVACGKTRFREGLVFTHRGLSGPSILQISSWWRAGDAITVDLAPGVNAFEALRTRRAENGRQAPATALAAFTPKRLAQDVADACAASGNLADISDRRLRTLADAVNGWRVTPSGTEGYRTAEVTLGGVDTDALDARTMEVKAVAGLHFIGEAVDVTGWLGGYNFQWAWSSGWTAGQAV